MLMVKALHIIFAVCWFAGVFYLPRLFVYHAQAEDQISKDRFKIMERKLYRGIIIPSTLLTLLFGGWYAAYYWSWLSHAGWFHAKLGVIFLLIGYNHMCSYYLKQFAQDKNQKDHVFFRWFNEVPVLFLLAIIVLAVVKPF